jgi:hypothetical protein
MKLIILFFFVMIYIHIYLHFKINPLNELSVLNDICKQEISNTCYYKLPFVFEGKAILNKQIDLSNNIRAYDSMPLLEPYVKFFITNTIHNLKSNKIIKLHKNLECRNFYIVHKGSVKVTCIHPKYESNFKNITSNTYSFIENHKQMIHLNLKENDILFVPNYWYVYIKSDSIKDASNNEVNKNTIIEQIHYSTILNQFTIFCNKNISKYYGI